MSCHSRSPAVEVVFEHQQYEQWPWWHLWTSEKHVSALTVTLHGAFKRACQPATWFSAICILFYLPSNNLSKSMGASSAVKQPAADLRYVDCNRQWCVWLLDLKNEHGITERCLKVCQVRIKLHPKKKPGLPTATSKLAGTFMQRATLKVQIKNHKPQIIKIWITILWPSYATWPCLDSLLPVSLQ